MTMMGTSFADDSSKQIVTEDTPVVTLDSVIVTAGSSVNGVRTTPSKTVVNTETFETVGPQISVLDVLESFAYVDFRGNNSSDPGVDSVFVRGFDAKRFVTAIDGLTLQKTGGRKSSNIVDYSLLPTFLIKEVEVLPGPHSAIYDSKAIGGVVNFVSQEPQKKESLKPDVSVKVGYASENTLNTTTTIRGAVDNFTYDLANRYYQTDGYLRNSETGMNTWYGRLGYLTPSDGYVTVSASTTDTEREAPVNNPGEEDGDYDSGYPETSGGLFDPYAQPAWDGESYVYRLNAHQPTVIGTLDIEAASGKENRVRAYYASIDATTISEMDTDWWQDSAKITDNYRWNDTNVTIVGYDFAKMYDSGGEDSEKIERIQKNGAFVQHTWDMSSSFQAQVGARYEDVQIVVTNYGRVVGRPDLVERNFDQLVPKSFFTWKLDDLAAGLRDTSLSAGISKIWRAPDYHGDYNPQGRPAGIYIEPEHGIGYDLILSRRLVGDVRFNIDMSFYDIEDYITGNKAYAKYSGASAGINQYLDYKINLEEVYRYGIDADLSGHIAEPLSFNFSYSWQEFDNRGGEPAGEEELDQRAAHRISAGVHYDILSDTELQLDYAYQSEETTQVSEEVADDVWDFREVYNDAYQTFDFAVEQKLPFIEGWLKNVSASVYVKNIFDTEYFNTSGFPATGRTFGATLRFSL
jgi:iron complex outermembrane receptor protein